MEQLKQSLITNARLLKTRVSKYALFGLFIACIAIIVATCLVSYSLLGTISIDGVVEAQRSNPAIWVLDLTPFLFSIWGQYASAIMAYEAGAMVLEQTSELRLKASSLEARVMHDMTHDLPTGLPNRALFVDRLLQALNAVENTPVHLSILMLDFSNLTEITASLGQYRRDRILKQLVIRLERVIHGQNTLARLGDVEFGVLLPKIDDIQEAVDIARKIKDVLKVPFVLEHLSVILQTNIGIAIFPDHGVDVDTLLQRAEVAMYAAKQDREEFILYSTALDKASQRRLVLMNELRVAVDNDQLELYFQPKVDIHTGEITAEALLRWVHPTHGLILAEDFIPMAERTGLIKELGEWVLKKALEHYVEWRQRGVELLISINLSPSEVLDSELSDKVIGQLTNYNVPPGALMFEITESATMYDQEYVLEILERLTEAGIRIILDRFGTGYSSLIYLAKLPINEIKIDRSFVIKVNQDKNSAVIVRTIIDLAHNLGIRVSATGVETKEALSYLRQLGCDAVQGSFISHPLSPAELDSWLSTSLWASVKQSGSGRDVTSA